MILVVSLQGNELASERGTGQNLFAFSLRNCVIDNCYVIPLEDK